MSCQVVLHTYGQITTGSAVNGTLEVYINDPEDVRSIKIRLKCKENTAWTERETYYDNQEKRHKTHYVNYTGDNEIVRVEHVLKSNVHLNSGRHQFNFSFHIPRDAPSSFSSGNGNISYYIKGIVDRPFKFDYTDTYNFIVVSPVDFNILDPVLQKPHKAEDEKSVCCFFCSSGPITMTMTVPKLALLPGLPFDIKVKITNMSNVSIDNLEIELKQKITFRVDYPKTQYRSDVEYLGTIKELGVGAHGEKEYNLTMNIPPNTPVYNFINCNLFEVKNKLEATACLPGCHVDLEVALHPKLGNIPFNGPPPVVCNNINCNDESCPVHFETIEEVEVVGDDMGFATVGNGSENNPPPYPLNFPNLPPGGYIPIPPYQNEKSNNFSNVPSAPYAGAYGPTAPPQASQGQDPPSYSEAVEKK